VSEQTAIATAADVTARLSTQAYNRLYAKNGGGAPADSVFLTLCLAEANSLFRSLTRAAFPDGVYTTTDTLDPALVGCVVDLCNDIAASRHSSYDAENGYAIKGAQARAFIKQLNRDADVRAPGSAAVRPLPVATLSNDTDTAGVTTHPYQGIRDGSVGSGY
jgi:hypothetical protein